MTARARTPDEGRRADVPVVSDPELLDEAEAARTSLVKWCEEHLPPPEVLDVL